jgi:membrane-associated phospholipid phosphatase
VNAVIVAVAQYLLYVLALAVGVLWLTLDRPGKWRLAADAVVGLAVVGLGIWLAAALHVDPRPFVHDPASTPLFPHPADNGFPSDHAAAGGLLTAVAAWQRRWLGALVGICAVLIAVARVAAHVHHAQDVVAGLGIGLAGGAIGIAVVGVALAARSRRAGRPPVRVG